VNPKIVAGQLYGGVVQGIGQCLMEETLYTEDGQLASGSFMDYALPHAIDAPWFTFDSLPSPATTNPLGVKGCGEAGVAGAVTSVMNAIVDALRPYGVHHVEMPATAEKLWSLIKAGRQ
jgi:carbon-monoxide dehydrogenase large subunit